MTDTAIKLIVREARNEREAIALKPNTHVAVSYVANAELTEYIIRDEASKLTTEDASDIIFAVIAYRANSCYEAIIDKTNVDQADKYGFTLLMYASYNGATDILKNLLLRNANVMPTDRLGYTALDYALILSRNECAKELIKYGSDYSKIINDSIETPAIAHYTLENVDKFIQENPEVITTASSQGLSAYINFRKEALDPANIDKRIENGSTYLISAAKNGNSEIVAQLLMNKADISSQDNDGHTARYYAAKNKNEFIINLLSIEGVESKSQTHSRKPSTEVTDTSSPNGNVLLKSNGYRPIEVFMISGSVGRCTVGKTQFYKINNGVKYYCTPSNALPKGIIYIRQAQKMAYTMYVGDVLSDQLLGKKDVEIEAMSKKIPDDICKQLEAAGYVCCTDYQQPVETKNEQYVFAVRCKTPLGDNCILLFDNSYSFDTTGLSITYIAYDVETTKSGNFFKQENVSRLVKHMQVDNIMLPIALRHKTGICFVKSEDRYGMLETYYVITNKKINSLPLLEENELPDVYRTVQLSTVLNNTISHEEIHKTTLKFALYQRKYCLMTLDSLTKTAESVLRQVESFKETVDKIVDYEKKQKEVAEKHSDFDKSDDLCSLISYLTRIVNQAKRNERSLFDVQHHFLKLKDSLTNSEEVKKIVADDVTFSF
jgi:hypothetical protein